MPCNKCSNYWPIKLGLDRNGDQKLAVRGWCVPKSKFPDIEQPGQVFPEGCNRVQPGQRAEPHIVVGAEEVVGCPLFQEKK